MHPAIPASAQPVLQTYLTAIHHELPGFLDGFYLHGSIALGAFNPRLSDIDFVAVASRPCGATDLAQLAAIHQQVVSRHHQPALQGDYVQWADLGRPEAAVGPRPSYSDGQLHPGGQTEMNLVTWWLVKNCGIALAGPEPQALSFSIDWDRLIADMRHNLNTYWRRYTRDPQRIRWLFTDYGIQWAVLGVLRQFYSFEQHSITSKTGAGEYGLGRLPVEWHKLIREALNLRAATARSTYRLRLVRAVEAFRFLDYVIGLSNSLFA